MGISEPTPRAIKKPRRKPFTRYLGLALSALMVTTFVVAETHLEPANAANNASVVINKSVNGQGVPNSVMPGTFLEYQIEFAARDGDADGPVIVTDNLPAAFAGWPITGLTAVYQGSETGITINMPGVASGTSHGSANPASGTIQISDTAPEMTVNVNLPVYPGVGNTSATGLPTGGVGLIRYTVQVPEELDSDSPVLDGPLVNDVKIDAKAGRNDITSSSSATIRVINPPVPVFQPTKTWTPAAQAYQPGLTSTVAIGVNQTANIAINRIELQDPADDALAPDGAATLPAGNPFNFVNFSGFGTPSDPTIAPPGVQSVAVEVYAFDGTVWNWIPWTSAIANEDIAGMRVIYESDDNDLPVNQLIEQTFSVEQRATNRSTDASLITGWANDNVASATVTTAAGNLYTESATGRLEVIAERVDVLADKKFFALPSGAEVASLTGGAGDSVGVVLRATNRPAPFSTELDSMLITEPAAGSNPNYFSENLQFGGFDSTNSAAQWPTGATSATLTWKNGSDPDTVVNLTAPAAFPNPADPTTVTGFEILFEGVIPVEASSEIRYTIDSSDSVSFVPNGGTSGSLLNRITVTGAEDGLDAKTSTADARLTLTAPSVTVGISKNMGPRTVVPGESVYVQLDSSLTASGANIDSTEIVVEDSLGLAPNGATNLFWNAFDLKTILAPISRPTTGAGTPITADLTVQYQEADGTWTNLQVNPPVNNNIPVPAGAIGVRFVYSNPAGLSQISYVKPNLEFVARAVLRDSGESTSEGFEDLQMYTNYSRVGATANVGDRDIPVTNVNATGRVGIRGAYPDPPVTGSGAWAAKSWAIGTLTSQSDVTTTSTQSWAIVDPGFTSAELQDPAVPTASGEGTVFEAFNLTQVHPILISGSVSGATVDPRLQWDTVTNVELWNGTSWVAVQDAPAGGWMRTTTNPGFVGYTLTPAERASALGVKITLAENTAARAAAAAAGDITAPGVGTGVASSVDVRTYNLSWQLRDKARVASSPPGSLPKWVIGSAQFNCQPLADNPGCVENTSRTTGVAASGNRSDDAGARIVMIDGRPGVGAEKTVQAINPANGQPYGPIVSGATPLTLTLPNTDDGVEPVEFPQARITINGSNTSGGNAEEGFGKLARIRLSDSVPADINLPLPPDDVFAGRDFVDEANAGETPFAKLDITRLSFGTLPAYIDPTESKVFVWVWQPAAGNVPGTATSQEFTVQQIRDSDPVYMALLQSGNIVGASVTYSGVDSLLNGNIIPTGVVFSMYMDVQLRATDRVTGERLEVIDASSDPTEADPNLITNVGVVGGWDAVLDPDVNEPDFQPAELSTATITLAEPAIAVDASKFISVQHGNIRNKVVYEADPQTPVDVALYAEPGSSSAPILSLQLEDQAPEFWEKFQLVSVGDAENPLDADVSLVQVKVGSAWVAYQGFTGDLASITGVRATFTRSGAEPYFPNGTASWSTSWGSASLPFVVQLREGADVDWNNGTQDNQVRATATHDVMGSVTDTGIDTVRFEIGTHVLRVEKHAPGDTAGDPMHPIDPLAYLNWNLVFTNTGNSLLPITEVTDKLPPTLGWDRLTPVFTSTAGINDMKGLTTDPAEIDVVYDEQTREITFKWPEGQRMYPDESMTIGIHLQMAPTLQGVQSVNTVVVGTGVELERCDVATDRGQTQPPGLEPDECGSQNFVTTKPGTFVRTEKGVIGESVETLGENLVTGSINALTGEACTLPQLPYFGADYVRFPCVSFTTLGATDSWQIQNVNVGSEPLNRMVIADMLPRAGDQTLGGGNTRESTFRPVLAGTTLNDVFTLTGLPSNTVVNLSVTTNPAACIGAVPGQSLWNNDPTCSDTVTNPANDWVPAASYTGALEDIAGFKFDLDMTNTPLGPTEYLGISFDTVNIPGDGQDVNNEKIVAELDRFQASKQSVWNQAGIVAWNTAGERTLTPLAPESAGVLIATGDLVITKNVLGAGAEFAPASFTVDLSCTVPSGNPNEERIPFDLGSSAQVTVPANGSVTIAEIPIGANCVAAETGAVGEFGEAGRSIRSTAGVTPATDGLSADILIRDQAGTEIEFVNTYTASGLTVEKSVLSTNDIAVTDAQRTGEYSFEVSCVVPLTGETITREFTVTGGKQHTVDGLPDNAQCQLTETRTGDAKATLITIGGVQSTGAVSSEFELSADGVYALVTNEFEGKKLETTGSQSMGAIVAIIAIVVLGTGIAVVLIARKRRSRAA